MYKSFILTALLLLPSISTAIECQRRECFINIYGGVDSDTDNITARVHEIYEKLTRTLGSQLIKASKMSIINSDGFPWAVALPDNSVVITTGAIKRLYQEGDVELGDARTAFVLGHELSHLTSDDLFHHKYFLFNTGSTLRRPESKPDAELRADLKGYTLASLAGYATDRLLDVEEEFFRTWLSQISDSNSLSHPGTNVRRDHLQERFQLILNDVPYYDFAVALAHFGHNEDAQILLEDSLNKVETAQAYSNLGYVYLQRAREKMPTAMAYKYWFPTVLEPGNALDIETSRSLFDRELPHRAQADLESAESNLKYAASLDDDLITNHINLSAVYMYLPGLTHRAYASIKDAEMTTLGRNPQVQQQLKSLLHLIDVEENSKSADSWHIARDTMMALADDDDAAENLIFNLARMLDVRGRDNTATKYWQRLYQKIDTLPPAYRAQVCFRLGQTKCGTNQRGPSPWSKDTIPLGQDIRNATVKNILDTHWSEMSLPPKKLPNLHAQVFANQHGDTLIALDHHIEMMILRNVPWQFSTIDRLENEFGDPEVTLPVDGGHLVSFDDGWSAYIQDDKVLEIWIAKI